MTIGCTKQWRCMKPLDRAEVLADGAWADAAGEASAFVGGFDVSPCLTRSKVRSHRVRARRTAARSSQARRSWPPLITPHPSPAKRCSD